jgi:hypothetical protein
MGHPSTGPIFDLPETGRVPFRLDDTRTHQVDTVRQATQAREVAAKSPTNVLKTYAYTALSPGSGFSVTVTVTDTNVSVMTHGRNQIQTVGYWEISELTVTETIIPKGMPPLPCCVTITIKKTRLGDPAVSFGGAITDRERLLDVKYQIEIAIQEWKRKWPDQVNWCPWPTGCR